MNREDHTRRLTDLNCPPDTADEIAAIVEGWREVMDQKPMMDDSERRAAREAVKIATETGFKNGLEAGKVRYRVEGVILALIVAGAGWWVWRMVGA